MRIQILVTHLLYRLVLILEEHSFSKETVKILIVSEIFSKSFQICTAPVNKSQVAVYNVTRDDKLNHTGTFNVLEPVKSLSADCGVICAALRTRYIIFNCEQGHVQELFPFDKDGFIPFICRVAKVS